MSAKRNQPCPCGSGLRFKKCCAPDGPASGSNAAESSSIQVRLEEPVRGINAEQSQSSDESSADKLRQAQSFYSRGVALAGQERLSEAIDCILEALALQPAAEVYYNLGMLQVRAGRTTEAIDSFRKSLALKDNLAEAHLQLGNVLFARKMVDDSLPCYQKFITLRPDSFEGYLRLGIALMKKEDYAAAAECLKRVLSQKPDHVEGIVNLGGALLGEGRLAEAASELQRAIDLEPDCAEAYFNLGLVHKGEERPEDAIACLEKALEIDPGLYENHHMPGYILADLYKQMGRFDDAVASFEKALECGAEFFHGHLGISSIRKYTPSDPHLAEMQKLWTDEKVTTEQRMYLAFSLGKAHEDIGRYEKAFAFLSEGNQLKRQTYEYDVAGTRQEFKQIAGLCDQSWWSGAAASSNNLSPIFIVGMPRSGSSLVEQILASHPEVAGAGELVDLPAAISKLTGTRDYAEIYRQTADDHEGLVARIGEEYAARVAKYAGAGRFFTDKFLLNFINIGIIRQAFPAARIVHSLRDPMDTCFSIYKNLFVGKLKFAYDLQELGHYYLAYQDLMRHWHELFPGEILDVRYEDLVFDQEGESRRLLDFCQLDWDERCLDFHRTSRKVATASAAQVRKPIYRSSVRLWKNYENQLEPLRNVLAGEAAI